jgi:rhodanese-related sulfurtransferase
MSDIDVDPAEVQRRRDGDEVQLVDVREANERDAGYIPGSRHIPYRLARQAAQNGLAGGKPVITICESGARAAVAASVLAAHGIDARPVLHGGISEWRGELVKFRRCGC